MTPMVDAILTLTSEQKSSTPQLSELDAALTHAARTARYFVRQRGRERDLFFFQEMKAEAYFIATELILTIYDTLLEKYPCEEERFRFYRMTVGYNLKAYCLYRARSTMSYLRSKGMTVTHVKLEDDYVPRNDNQALMNLMLEEAARTPMERQVLEFYLMANSIEVIGEKVNLSPQRVKKVMRRIKRRLKRGLGTPASSDRGDGDKADRDDSNCVGVGESCEST